MVTIKRYSDDKADTWNQFNRQSKNGLFMFDRKYMDYHRDRFTDHSLMFLYKGKLIAILPICENGNRMISHGGLTFGGFITDANMKQHIMLDCFEAMCDYAKENGFEEIHYKCIPHIYHNNPAEEDRFALFFCGAALRNVDVSTYINLSEPIKMSKGRRAQILRAKRDDIRIEELSGLSDFEAFIDIENEVLSKRHGVRAVHTGKELKLLHDSFPENIHLIVALESGRMIAGTVVYEYKQVVHTQYMAADDEARKNGALDLVVATVIERYKANKRWLDFGISTEHGRIFLNKGLCAQKEGFGGRTGVYETWEIKL